MLFKNVIIAVILLSFTQCVYSSECITVRGNNDCTIVLTAEIAKSVPRFAAYLENNPNDKLILLDHMNSQQLDFLSTYANKRFLLEERIAGSVTAAGLESSITNMNLETLVLHTVGISELYGETVPTGFFDAWHERLPKVERGEVEDLFHNEKLVEQIYAVCWEDPLVPAPIVTKLPSESDSHNRHAINILDILGPEVARCSEQKLAEPQSQSHSLQALMKTVGATVAVCCAIYNKDKLSSCFNYIKGHSASVMRYVLGCLGGGNSSIVISNSAACNITVSNGSFISINSSFDPSILLVLPATACASAMVLAYLLKTMDD